MYDEIKQQISNSIHVKEQILNSGKLLSEIQSAAEFMIDCYQNGHKVILCGNGGSASDALHIEGELVGRFKMERKALPAIAITANAATMTAIGNDYDNSIIFERQIEAHGNQGDVLIAISTSGNSLNIIKAIIKAKEQGLKTIVFTGKDGGECKKSVDIAIVVPSDDTARIQESHIMIGHILCDMVEKALFGNV